MVVIVCERVRVRRGRGVPGGLMGSLLGELVPENALSVSASQSSLIKSQGGGKNRERGSAEGGKSHSHSQQGTLRAHGDITLVELSNREQNIQTHIYDFTFNKKSSA